MNIERWNRTTPQARTIAAKADETAAMRRMEIAFLITATAVMLATVELVVAFHLH
jgi:hypothetical protein